MIEKSASIEHHQGDARGLGSFSDHFADDLGARGFVCALTGAIDDLLFKIARGEKRVALSVIDHLRINMRVRAEDVQSWPLGCPGY